NAGEWHQYDDIVCKEPSKEVMKRIKEFLWSKQRKKIIEGREVAGSFMLQTIFDLLRSWSTINLGNFFCQLQQFYEVYGNPFVFEKTIVKWGSLEYGEKDVKKLLKGFMLEWVIPELQKDHKGKNAFNMEPLNAALILLYVWGRYSLELDNRTLSHLCTALCLPKLPKEEFLSFWAGITESFSIINTFRLSDMVEALINRVRGEHTSNWIIVIPLLHLLKGTSEPFQPVLNQVNAQYEKCWVGLQGLKLEYVKNRRAMLDLMKAHAHLVELDRLLARSWMYLMTLDELVECDSFIHAELLDILQLFTMKCPKEISNSTSTSVLKILEHIQLHLLEQRYSCLNEDYGIQCIQAACKLLEMICKRVSHALTDIPVACMNLVAAVSGFAQTTQQTDTFSEKTCELLRYAKQTVRRWIGQTFRGRLINTSYQTAASFTREIEMWNNIVSIQFVSKDFTKEWRETFTRDFEGKYQKEDPLDQIQVYCSKVEELHVSKPFLVGSVEKCALQAVAAQCQEDPLDQIQVYCSKVEELHVSKPFLVGSVEKCALQAVAAQCQRHVDFKKERLDSIDDELVQAKIVLVEITESRRLCLQELSRRKNFVTWVKEVLQDINELKVFVDLASISAGENDMEVDRVACFHDAVLGYSSMLYDLKPDADFKLFKETLKNLWKALDNDRNLPKKLSDSARHLEWLKTVKDSHGSVETSSLSLASAINMNGIYIISAQNQKLCLEDILKLHIMEEHDEGCETRIYSFEDLRELQNKLMLMSGKGDQGQREVNRFAEVFASVQRLACAFIDLFVAGNPLFRHWKAKINCNSKEECIIMDLDLGSVVSVMIEGDVTEQLPEVCRKMESCLCFWKAFMDKQRSQHYYLNYFTSEQVVYLCSQLTQKNDTELKDQVLMMLSFIKPNWSFSDVTQAWHRLQYEVIKKDLRQNDDLEFQTFAEVPSMIKHDLNTDEPCALFDNLASQLRHANGSEKLDVIWNAYMRDMNNFLPDCLDVRSLGYLLEMLANSPSQYESDSKQDEKTSNIQRELPNGMATGKPNLIICPSEEILITCISMYMRSRKEPLPTYDEVLLCSASTPYEEVELFLRRCLSDGYRGKKIYTMLYVDQLTYEVSYKVEQFFHQQNAQSRNDYRLVLVCSSNKEHAYLPSAFSQFRLHLVPQEPMINIQQYLVRHFTVPADISSAAAVFKDRQFVGVVFSERSGVGKSLYVKRMHEKLKTITDNPTQLKCIRLTEPRVDENIILKSLLNNFKKRELSVYHFDITTMVKTGLHEFLFRLLILGYLIDSEGNMWKRNNEHLYVIEILRPDCSTSQRDRKTGAFMDVFQSVYCRPPKEVLELEMRIQEDPSLVEGDDPLMDDQEFQSEAYQRPYQYLQRFYNGINLDTFRYQGVEGTHVECLQMLFVYCGIVDPSWAELRNFAWFLNLQLRDYQRDTEITNPILWSLIMAVGVCYHACLEDKQKYRENICRHLPETYSPMKVMQEISLIQDLFLSGVPLGETIARNNALKENVFMMVICIELRIPLFLVGKPGSSKSLSKTLVADGMQGQAAHSDLFKKLKQIHLVSFQCSPHSTPDGIINTFKQSARFQKDKNLSEYVSVVVLDEIGLAEDSQKMPLKTLHPLLEEGCIDDQPVPHKKVGFIGISNWALDPAKMNRGIFVSRSDPDQTELINTAEGICSSNPMILERVREYFQPFACAYLNICNEQGRGFFGLRDYYSLIKMIFAVAQTSEQRKKPSAEQIVTAVLRNFSGKDNVDAVAVFTSKLNIKPKLENVSTIELVRENITAIGQDEECRYLLVLTKNYAALQILQHMFFSDLSEKTILVQNYIAVDSNVGCTMPFSWRIKDHLEELWVHAFQQEGHSLDQFEEFFWKIPLGGYISEATQEMQMEFFHRYLQDFISMTMKVTSVVNLELLCGALTCGVNELKGSQEIHESEVISLPWVHAAYHRFKNRIQNVYRMISIEPQIAQRLLDNTCAREGTELVLDVYTALACIECLEPQALDEDGQSLAWLRRVKKLQVPIELVCCEESLRHYGEKSNRIVTHIQHGWHRIYSLALFVQHMLLGVEDVHSNLRPLVLDHTRRLAQVLEQDSDLKNKQPFEAAVIILKACKDEASQSIFRFGSQLCPVCMEDPQDPLSLPCDHIFCLTCIKQWLVPGQMLCPLCRLEVPDDFELKASETIQGLIHQNALFRKRCNAFFIDLVSTMCFKDSTPPSMDIIQHLLSLLMVEARSLPQIRGQDRKFLTKPFSPFDDSVDKNPVVRSVVLKLLLKYSFDDVKHYLQQHLTEVEQSNIIQETDKTELYSLYINSLEVCAQDDPPSITSVFLNSVNDLCCQSSNDWYRVYLIRKICSLHGVEYVQKLLSQKEFRWLFPQEILNMNQDDNKIDHYVACGLDYKTIRDAVAKAMRDCDMNEIQKAIEHCKSTPMKKAVYLLMALFREVTFLYRNGNPNSDPKSENQDDNKIDHYVACGLDYKTIRDAVAKAMRDCDMNEIQKAIEQDFIRSTDIFVNDETKAFAKGLVNNHLHALRVQPQMSGRELLLVEVTVHMAAVLLCGNLPLLEPLQQLALSPNNMTASFIPTMPDDMLAVAQQAIKGPHGMKDIFVNDETKAFAKGLVNNHLHALRVQPQMSGRELLLVEVTVHMAAVLLCGNLPLLEPLQQLALSPNNMTASFIPTMPDDMLAVAQQAIKGPHGMKACPNGHPCIVDMCGLPMEVARCLECNAEIGGIDHKPVDGFQTMQIQADRTQSGHILGDAHRRDQPDMQDTKNMSPAPFALLRLLTHTCMRLGAQNNTQSVMQIIKPAVPDPGPFLMAHLLKDMEQLIRALGKGVDDTISTIHLTIHSLLDPHQASQWPAPYDETLSSKDARNGWENAMNTDVITHQLKVLEKQLKEVNEIIRKDERVSSNPVMKLAFGKPELFLRSLPQNSLIHNSSIWSCRRKISALSLAHIVEQNNGQDTLCILRRFLQREAELRLVKFLPDILVLQKDLVKKFQNVTDLTSKTIGEFLDSHKEASLAWYKKCINIFLSTWNQLRVSLATTGEIKLPAEYTQKDLSLDADLQVLLPQRRGLGLCSTALVSYLIALHNDLVYTMEKHTGEESGYTVSPADLTEMHVIHYEYERDLLPLILSNCQYSMECGQETLMEYDLPNIQQQIFTRFLQGKPLITLNGIPTVVNRQDRIYEIILMDVKGKVPQEPLQALTQHNLVKELQSYSDVCEALSTVELALGFLAMTGGEPRVQLGTYLEEVLQMTDNMAPHVFKVGHEHTLSS
ncbi:E3 ubiquitin-protein ligase rnf213-alpha-like, partial [Sinocyclocheilus grahami]|uniref:E3 ubiquitin-protein ligase rnf213-alpha-like n=1 Tax=Sinocyclocheilus grahami TaxID=75366 RepID=UPI0007ACF8F2